MGSLTTRRFWYDVTERSVKTFAQAAVALLASGATGLLDVNWLTLVSVSGLAALVSLLTSIASSGTNTDGTASLVR